MLHTTESNSKKVKVHFLSSRHCNLVSETNYKHNTVRCTAIEAIFAKCSVSGAAIVWSGEIATGCDSQMGL